MVVENYMVVEKEELHWGMWGLNSQSYGHEPHYTTRDRQMDRNHISGIESAEEQPICIGLWQYVYSSLVYRISSYLQ